MTTTLQAPPARPRNPGSSASERPEPGFHALLAHNAPAERYAPAVTSSLEMPSRYKIASR